MPTTEIENAILNCQLIEVPYSTVLRAIEATESDPFSMTISCDVEWVAIAQCVNRGIDAYLEACFIRGRDTYDRGECKVSHQSLCVLLRRLGDTEFKQTKKYSSEEIWDAASSLQSSILMVLGIDEYGCFVGREAMGLD